MLQQLLNSSLLLNQYGLEIRSMQACDLETLTKLAVSPKIWQHHRVEYFKPAIFKRDWFDKALIKQKAGERFPFILIWQGEVVGSSSFYEVSSQHRRLTIGYTWYSPKYWGTLLNTIAKFILMEYAFEELDFTRVAYCIDKVNQRSCRAVEKLGIKREGVLRNHIIRPDGAHRDSVIYAATTADWVGIKAVLLDRIHGF